MNRIAYKNRAAYAAWADRHRWCQCCGVPQGFAPWPGLSTHHIIKPGRSDDATNLLRLCHRCHQLAEGLTVRLTDGSTLPRLSIGICLTIKCLREPDEYKSDRLRQLFGRSLPDMDVLPIFFRREFCGWHHYADCDCCGQTAPE